MLSWSGPLNWQQFLNLHNFLHFRKVQPSMRTTQGASGTSTAAPTISSPPILPSPVKEQKSADATSEQQTGEAKKIRLKSSVSSDSDTAAKVPEQVDIKTLDPEQVRNFLNGCQLIAK